MYYYWRNYEEEGVPLIILKTGIIDPSESILKTWVDCLLKYFVLKAI